MSLVKLTNDGRTGEAPADVPRQGREVFLEAEAQAYTIAEHEA